MERVSAVTHIGNRTAILCTVLMAAISGQSICLADPAPSTARSNGPQRPAVRARQAAESSFDSPDDPDAEGTKTAGATGEVVADELPEHIHPQHPLVPALKMAYASRGTLRNVRDYTAQFVKKELIGNRYIVHNMDMKFREQPFSVHLSFREPNVGRQVLYVAGANGGQLLAQEGGIKGLVGTVALDPNAPLAMSENRHPITEIGISNMLEAVIRQWEAEGKYGETDVKYFPKAKLGEFPVRVIRTSHPTRRRQFKFHMTQLYLDDQTLFPVRVEQYDWPQREGEKPVQIELYMYSDVRTNQGLGNTEFDPRRYRLR